MPSIKSAIRYGYNTFVKNWKISVLATLIIFALQMITGLNGENKILIGILNLAAMIASIIAHIGYTKMFLRIHDGEKPEVMDIWNEYRLLWRFLGVSILTGLIVVAGLIALIIPGFLLAVRLSFSSMILIDTKMGIISSIKESWNITRGSIWKLSLFGIIVGLINVAGIIVFGIGVILTMPVTLLATVYVYRELSRAKAGLAVPPTTEPETSPQIS